LDDPAVRGFVNFWAYRENVFIPKAVGVKVTLTKQLPPGARLLGQF